jgi:PKHD-type hydroxylase
MNAFSRPTEIRLESSPRNWMSAYLLDFPTSAARAPRPNANDEPLQDLEFQAGFICSPLKFPYALSAAECDAIVELGRAGPPVIAGLSRPVQNYRNGMTRTLTLSNDSQWIYQKVRDFFAAVNQWYRFEIAGMIDSLLYCEYPIGGHFDWHLDCGEHPTGTRKISLSLQLSSGDEYAGGALEFSAYGELAEARQRGTIIAFPSFLHHRVTTVQSGVRRCLIAWAHGPVFR